MSVVLSLHPSDFKMLNLTLLCYSDAQVAKKNDQFKRPETPVLEEEWQNKKERRRRKMLRMRSKDAREAMTRQERSASRRVMTKSADSLHENQTLNLDSPDENTERADVKIFDEVDGDLLECGNAQVEDFATALDGNTVPTASLPGALQN